MLRTSGLLSVCCECPAGAGLHRRCGHPMVVETLVSPNATRSQQCTQMPQTNVERPFSPICVHSYCVFPCGRARRSRLTGPGATPPQPGGGLLERICPVGPLFIVPRRLAGGYAPRPRAATSRKGAFCATRRPQTAPFREASGGMRLSARPRGPPPQPRRRPPQVGPGNRRAPAAARDVAADARPHPCE